MVCWVEMIELCGLASISRDGIVKDILTRSILGHELSFDTWGISLHPPGQTLGNFVARKFVACFEMFLHFDVQERRMQRYFWNGVVDTKDIVVILLFEIQSLPFSFCLYVATLSSPGKKKKHNFKCFTIRQWRTTKPKATSSTPTLKNQEV